MKKTITFIITIILLSSCSPKIWIDEKLNNIDNWMNNKVSDLETTASGYYLKYTEKANNYLDEQVNNATDYGNQKIEDEVNKAKDDIKDSIKESINNEVDKMFE